MNLSKFIINIIYIKNWVACCLKLFQQFVTETLEQRKGKLGKTDGIHAGMKVRTHHDIKSTSWSREHKFLFHYNSL